MRPAWLRALSGCLQMIVRSNDDIEVESGEVSVGEIRARALGDLRQALDDAQMLSLLWLALADVATWPQLPIPDAIALALALESGTSFRSVVSTDLKDDLGSQATQHALELLAVIDSAAKRSAEPMVMPVAETTAIRLCVNSLARESGAPIAYWEKWLRRVVPAAVAVAPNAAKSLALAALRATLAVPRPWEYAAFLATSSYAFGATKGIRVSVVTPDRRGHEVLQLGTFVDCEPTNRKIAAKFSPRVPIDPYRMGYIFRSTYMTDFLDDAKTGYYDSVICTNTSTGESWDYSRL